MILHSIAIGSISTNRTKLQRVSNERRGSNLPICAKLKFVATLEDREKSRYMQKIKKKTENRPKKKFLENFLFPIWHKL